MLGSRLRRGTATEEDQVLLRQWIRAHDPPMSYVSSVLREVLGYQNTPRLKTVGTLVDKLRREESNLFEMDDIAGLRLEPVADRLEQDAVVAAIVEHFPGSRVRDRRATPSTGYRAVHVIVRIDVHRVEVQVRTRLQHSWAETNEKLADLAGRGLRYGEPHPDPTITVIHERFLLAAEAIASYEAVEATFKQHVARHHRSGVSTADVIGGAPESRIEDIQVVLDSAKADAQRLVGLLKEAVLMYETSNPPSEDQ